MIRLGIYGANGKMGQEIFKCSLQSTFAKVSALYDRNELNFDAKDAKFASNLEELFENCDVVIDFSSPEGTKELISYARTNPLPIVIGTTGLSQSEQELINHASALMPILQASNMSLGVAVLNKLTSLASKALEDFDAEILEMHHRFKKDAPSGTAMTLANTLAKARNLDLEKVRVSGRDGIIGKRSKDEIAVMSLRGGDIVGRHTVGFYGDGEFIELNHTATSRATFANGAIKAAVWLSNKEAKLYSINDCLGL